MKRIFLMAIGATIILCSCSKQGNNASNDTKLKSLEFSIDVATPKTRMSDATVDGGVKTAVRENIEKVTIKYFDASDNNISDYDLTPDQILTLKDDNESGTRKAVSINNIPPATQKVNVYLNTKTSGDINDLQTSYKIMEYRGDNPETIVLTGAGAGDGGNDIYSVKVAVKPILSRFEMDGDAGDITINSSTSGTLPTTITNGTRDAALAHVSEASILAAELSARDAWKVANPSTPDPTWTYTYNVSFAYNATPYTITSIDEYYINNIPLTATGALVLNANNASNDWNQAAKDRYNASTGTMKKMFDVTAPGANERIIYNLFPQTFTPATVGAPTVAEVKASMPHIILKLTTSAGNKWLTIRAFREATPSSPLISKFEAGKVYILKASEIVITQYTASVTATANGTSTGTAIPEDKDPTDLTPEPQGKDLDLLVDIVDWTVTNMKPEW